MTRYISLEGIANFRDFGGYKAGDRTMKSGLLYRSAQHTFASDADLLHLSGMNIKTVIDLRRPSERDKRPSRRWDGFGATLIEAGGEYESDIVWEDFIKTSDFSADSFRSYLTDFYKSAPLAPRHVELFSRYFAALAEIDGPLVVHCAGGKDRTGMICALTHTLAGVHEDDMMEDFLATNNHVRHELIANWAKDIGEEIGCAPPKPENLIAAASVEPDYLHTAFKTIRAEHGSIENYFERALGVDTKRRAAIKERILA